MRSCDKKGVVSGQGELSSASIESSHPVIDVGDLDEISSGTIYDVALRKTCAEYNEIAPSFVKTVSLPDIVSKERARIEHGIRLVSARGKDASSVLDVGCAGARDLEVWVDNDISYYGVDYSERMIDIARTHFTSFNRGEASFKQANILDMVVVPSSVSLLWCSSVIQHLPKDRVAEVLGKFYRALEPGGILYLNVRPPKHGVPIEGLVASREYERLDGTKFVERFISHYTMEEINDLLVEAGFIVEGSESYQEAYDQYDDGGEKAAYLPEKFVAFARKPLIK